MRSTFSFGHFRRSVQARARGVSDAEIALREALPFDVLELFLIHRDSGLLLHQLSDTEDAELVSGMLTAVRDFVQDAFGRGAEGTLDELHYGDMQIFAEAGKYSYIAAVTRGYEPMGYRSRMRTQVLSLEHKYFKVLRQYDGDASRLVNVEAFLTPLTVAQDTSATQQAQHDHTQTGDIEADRTESDNIESGDIESGDIVAVSGGKGVQGGGRKNQVDVATDGGKWSPIDGEHDHRRKEALPTRGAGVPRATYGEEESVIAPLLPLIVVVGSVILLMVALWLLV